MSRIQPIHWRRLRGIFELDGFVFHKGKGDHWVGEKAGITRPIIVPEYSEIGLDIIRSNMRTAAMSRERYLQLLQRT